MTGTKRFANGLGQGDAETRPGARPGLRTAPRVLSPDRGREARRRATGIAAGLVAGAVAAEAAAEARERTGPASADDLPPAAASLQDILDFAQVCANRAAGRIGLSHDPFTSHFRHGFAGLDLGALPGHRGHAEASAFSARSSGRDAGHGHETAQGHDGAPRLGAAPIGHDGDGPSHAPGTDHGGDVNLPSAGHADHDALPLGAAAQAAANALAHVGHGLGPTIDVEALIAAARTGAGAGAHAAALGAPEAGGHPSADHIAAEIGAVADALDGALDGALDALTALNPLSGATATVDEALAAATDAAATDASAHGAFHAALADAFAAAASELLPAPPPEI